MKKAIKWLVIMVVVIVVTAAAGTTAFASKFDTQADSLKELGLFSGTNNGYELDRTPTRAEAAASLVRLLGKEAEAKAGTYETPFTDVPDWAAPYVGYLYSNGLTKGTTESTFGSGDACSAQMFTTFVLRALGYSESGGDFTYAGVLDYAVSIGLTQGFDAAEEFKRDEMVALLYSALFQPLKDDGATLLLEKLVSDNAVDAAAADTYLDSYDAFQSLQEMSTLNTADPNQSMTIDMQMMMTMGDITQKITSKTDMAVMQDGSDYRMRMDSASDMDGTTQNMTMYYADGWMYMNVDGVKTKYKAEYDPDEMSELLSQSDLSDLSNTTEPFYFIKSAEKTETDTSVCYKIEYSDAMISMFESMLSSITQMPGETDMDIVTFETVLSFDKDGNLQNITMIFDIIMTITYGQDTMEISCIMNETATINATGSAVTVTPPDDLDEYEEIEAPDATAQIPA